MVGGRWSVGTVTVSSWSCHQPAAAGQGRGQGGPGLRDWSGQLGVAAIVASDQCTIKARVRAWDKRRWRGGRGGGGAGKSQRAVFWLCTSRRLESIGGRRALWASGPVWGMESTIDKAPATADGGQFPGRAPSCHWAFGHVENGNLVWERRAHESQVDKRLLS